MTQFVISHPWLTELAFACLTADCVIFPAALILLVLIRQDIKKMKEWDSFKS